MSVIVPTYRRPDQLARCLSGLAGQQRLPDEVLVVRRSDDADSASVLSQAAVRECLIDRPGVLAAMTAGAEAAKGEILVFLDDDAMPRPDWLGRIVKHFENPTVGGASGRDVIPRPAQTGALTTDVGRVTCWGRVIGNHHLGKGPPRDVEVLKGANMAFRRSSLSLPTGLRGSGAQTHYEVATCLWAIGRGWRLIYDPMAVVDHEAAIRFGADKRDAPSLQAIRDSSFNLVASLLAARPELLLRRAAYGLLVGDRATPGLGRAIAALLQRDREVLQALVPSLVGQVEALAAHVQGKRLGMRAFE